jgi:hypothetical protein
MKATGCCAHFYYPYQLTSLREFINMIDVNQAQLDPTSVFAHPKDVLSCTELKRDQKIDILRRWAYDAKELETATDENMAAVHGYDHLEEVLKALNELGAGIK